MIKKTATLDELRRICLPRELVDFHGWSANDTLLLYNDEDRMVIELSKSYNPMCAICFALESAFRLNGRDICSECIASIKNA